MDTEKIKKMRPEYREDRLKSGKIQEEKQYEQCVLCRKITDIPIELAIDYRAFYLEGAGQLCYNCFKKLYG